MKRTIAIYRMLGVLLSPVAFLFAVFAVALIMAALSNPPLLLPLFAIVCVAIYIFSSMAFLNKGILRAQPCRRSLKDLVQVNAIVAGIFALLMMFQSLLVVFNPELTNQAIEQLVAMQPDGTPKPPASLRSMLTGIVYFMGVFCFFLLIHIFITFRLLKQYRHVFHEPGGDS
ncbi:MAG TPA: hypothetical protein VF145_08130 [Chitinophagaceae bacterium]